MTLSAITAQEALTLRNDDISKAISTSPAKYKDLPECLRGEGNLKGNFEMNMSIIAIPGIYSHLLVVASFAQIGGLWNSNDIEECSGDKYHVYAYDFFGSNNRYGSVAPLCVRQYLQEAGGTEWVLRPVAEVRHANQDENDAFSLQARKEYEYVMRETKSVRSAIELDIWAKTQSSTTNEHSVSPLAHLKPRDIQLLLNTVKKEDKKGEASTMWAHTLLDIQPNAVPAIVKILKSMPKRSPFAVGLAGWGNSYILNVILAAGSRYEKGSSKPEVYIIKDWDEVRSMEFDKETPLLFDDGVLQVAY